MSFPTDYSLPLNFIIEPNKSKDSLTNELELTQVNFEKKINEMKSRFINYKQTSTSTNQLINAGIKKRKFKVNKNTLPQLNALYFENRQRIDSLPAPLAKFKNFETFLKKSSISESMDLNIFYRFDELIELILDKKIVDSKEYENNPFKWRKPLLLHLHDLVSKSELSFFVNTWIKTTEKVGHISHFNIYNFSRKGPTRHKKFSIKRKQ